jgi:hypothetical protein
MFKTMWIIFFSVFPMFYHVFFLFFLVIFPKLQNMNIFWSVKPSLNVFKFIMGFNILEKKNIALLDQIRQQTTK